MKRKDGFAAAKLHLGLGQRFVVMHGVCFQQQKLELLQGCLHLHCVDLNAHQ